MSKAVKLSDIANIVGVSIVTVSKALSDQKGVSEELRTKIKAVASELGYKQPSVARKESIRYHSHRFGVLIADSYLDKYQSFYWNLYQEVSTYAMDYECFAMLEVVSGEMEQTLEMPKLLREHLVEGIIIIGKLSREFLDYLRKGCNVPIVYLDFMDGRANSDAVISDSYYGAYHLTNYLISKGHRDIAFVGTILATPSITDRYYGYVKALLQKGIQPRPEWQIDDRHPESGIFADELLKLPEKMPTAFFCNCDILAAKFIHLLNDNGYRVPEDVSVVGFDNYVHPGICNIGITTYAVEQKDMAEQAMNILIKRMNHETCQYGTRIVEGHLIRKESVAPR